MERIVEIANFQQADRAEVLASLLRAEGIDCYVRNETSARTFGGLVDIGARVEVLESDVSRALEIIEIGGFFAVQKNADETMMYNQTEEEHNNAIESKFAFDKKMIIFIIILGILIAILIYLGSFLSSPKY